MPKAPSKRPTIKPKRIGDRSALQYAVSSTKATSGAFFDQAYLVDQKNDDPEHFRAIGWCDGRLYSVISAIQRDEKGEYHRLITASKATLEEQQSYAQNI